MRVGLIGGGRIGRIRARTMAASGVGELVAVADQNLAAAEELAAAAGARAFADWRTMLEAMALDAVVVATPTLQHAPMVRAVLERGVDVLCEKPLARTAAEARELVELAWVWGRVLKTGFNYRHLPHVCQARELIASGQLGKVFLLRGVFGHGGRPGFDREWHTDPAVSGGGVLLEQGIHLLDLVRHLLGEPVRVVAKRSAFFWDLRGTEDNSFCLFECAEGRVAQLQVSWTEWVNRFDVEIFGSEGFVRLTGRDGHYGVPRLEWGRRKPDHSRPEMRQFEYPPGEDWLGEWREFAAAVAARREAMGSGADGVRALEMVEAAYASSASGAWVELARKN